MEESDIRPLTVLTDYLRHSGLDRHRHAEGQYQMVGRYDVWNDLADDFRPAFVVLSIGGDIDEVLEAAYMDSIELIRNDFDQGLGDRCRKLGALVFVMYGEAMLARHDESAPLPPDTPPEYMNAAGWGMSRSRLVHVVTPDGFATHTLIFPPEDAPEGTEPLEDISEYWQAEVGETPHISGKVGPIPRVTDLMSMILGIGLLLGIAVERETEPTIVNMARIAGEFATGDSENGNMADSVLKLMVTFGEYVDQEAGRFANLSDELRRLLEGDD